MFDHNTEASIPETTFSLDAIPRLVCNTLDEVLRAQTQGDFQFDAIIIGSGMYGAYGAAKLFELSRNNPRERRPRILVLESGPFLLSEHFQNQPRLGRLFQLVARPLADGSQSFLTQVDPTDNHQNGLTPHHQCVGGKSLFWGGWSPRLTPEDLALWPVAVRRFLESPAGYDFVERQIGVTSSSGFINGPLFDTLKSRCQQLIDTGAVSTLNEVTRAPIAVQTEAPASGLFSMDKFSSLPLLLDAILRDTEDAGGWDAHRSLFLVPNTQVIKLETRNGRVRELVLAQHSPSRRKQRVVHVPLKDSAMVFLAGNTVNSTRLALTSLPKPPALGEELMGRNLMAHVRGNYFWRLRVDALGLPHELSELGTTALHLQGAAPLADGREGRFHLQLYALGTLGDNPEEYLYRVIPSLEELERARHAMRRSEQNEWLVVGIRTCGEMFGRPDADPTRRDASFISINPFGGSGDDVYLEDDGTELRVPKPFVCLVQREEDAQVRRAQTAAAFELATALAGQDTDSIQLLRGNEDGLGTSYHESGTLWMGEDPASSVSDVYGHLHHITNVYGLDQALFPTVGSANPVPTGLALSHRVMTHVASRFESSAPPSDEEGFRSLFDGTLDGWSHLGSGSFRVLEGLGIVEAGTPGTDSALGLLRYDREQFKNFILRLEWKAFCLEANSGIFLRVPEARGADLDALYPESIEIQIDETGKDYQADRQPQAVYGSSLHKTGAVYGLFPATRWASKVVSPHSHEGYWNAFEIRVEDEHVRVTLNGEPVSSGTLPAHLVKAGFIALQCHSDVLQFRDIRIKAL